MVNATCAMLCDIALINSYHGHPPGYIGNYTIAIYNTMALAGTAVAAAMYIGQQLLRGCTREIPEGSCKARIFNPTTVSAIKWTALTIATIGRVVGMLDQVQLLVPGAPPTDYFPVWDIGYSLSGCRVSCGE